MASERFRPPAAHQGRGIASRKPDEHTTSWSRFTHAETEEPASDEVDRHRRRRRSGMPAHFGIPATTFKHRASRRSAAREDHQRAEPESAAMTPRTGPVAPLEIVARRCRGCAPRPEAAHAWADPHREHDRAEAADPFHHHARDPVAVRRGRPPRQSSPRRCWRPAPSRRSGGPRLRPATKKSPLPVTRASQSRGRRPIRNNE
jgi:hypothetical protein